MWLDDCCSRYIEDGSENLSPNALVGCRTSVGGSRWGGNCDGIVRMSMLKSLCCLETDVGTSRSGLVTPLSHDISLVCRRPLILSLLESRCKAFAHFCCWRFLSDDVMFCNLALAVCVDCRLELAAVSTCCDAFVVGVEVLNEAPVAGKSAAHIHCLQEFSQQEPYRLVWNTFKDSLENSI